MATDAAQAYFKGHMGVAGDAAKIAQKKRPARFSDGPNEL
jgi:hypothetical protein